MEGTPLQFNQLLYDEEIQASTLSRTISVGSTSE